MNYGDVYWVIPDESILKENHINYGYRPMMITDQDGGYLLTSLDKNKELKKICINNNLQILRQIPYYIPINKVTFYKYMGNGKYIDN
jgi:hypothetical protein